MFPVNTGGSCIWQLFFRTVANKKNKKHTNNAEQTKRNWNHNGKKDMGMFFVKNVYSIAIQFNFLRNKVNFCDNQRMFTERSLMNISSHQFKQLPCWINYLKMSIFNCDQNWHFKPPVALCNYMKTSFFLKSEVIVTWTWFLVQGARV